MGEDVKAEITFDVVDLLGKLNMDFPFAKFITEDLIKRSGGCNEYNYHQFKLSSLRGQTFDPTLKTTICLRENGIITESNYNKLKNQIHNAFKL